MITIPEEIIKSLPNNRLVIFVGSGFSKPLGFLDWNSLAAKAIDEYKLAFANVSLLRECLAKNVLNEILVFDALKEIDSNKIISIIKSNNNHNIDVKKLINHKKLWRISNKIITTNYDKALEISNPDSSIEIISYNNIFEIGNILKKDKWLFHLHGMIDNTKECVIFSENYHKLYNEKHPAIEQLKSIALHNTILFIGFSMKDKYVAKLFSDLNLVFSGIPSSEHFILLQENEQLSSQYVKKIPIDSYANTGEFLDILIASKESQLQSPVTIKAKYLRRRCRTFHGGTDAFNKIMLEIRHEENSVDRILTLKEKVSNLKGYEKTLAKACLLENCGDIEKMIKVLNKASFVEEQENTRLLFLAIALEKLDKINSALTILDKIISKIDVEPEMLFCAKFNRCICSEKVEKYDEVYFESLIHNSKMLSKFGERIKDKAIANFLIVCDKTNIPFNYEDEINESIEFEINNTSKSQSKNLINYILYKKESISKDKFLEIMNFTKKMTISARVAILCNVFKKIEDSAGQNLKDSIIKEVEGICKKYPSRANIKHLREIHSL